MSNTTIASGKNNTNCMEIYTLFICNRLYTFPVDNGCMEANIQKGFWKKISGYLEHIETLTHMINNARIRQCCCDTFMTSPIKVQRGVLQGYSLSPLFNLIVNTLINTIKSEKVECIGYVYNGALSPKHWFQFADDTVIITALERDNHLLCNAFLKWPTWADLIIRVDKCHTFGMKTSKIKSIQLQPFITLKKERMPPAKLEESFTYL